VIITDEKQCREWLLKEFNIDDFKRVIGYEVNGKLNIVVGYDRYLEKSICIHVYYKGGFVSKDFIYFTHAYPFLQLGCDYTVAMMNSSNKKVLRLAARTRYEVKSKIDGIFNDGDLIIATLKKEDWQMMTETA